MQNLFSLWQNSNNLKNKLFTNMFHQCTECMHESKFILGFGIDVLLCPFIGPQDSEGQIA